MQRTGTSEIRDGRSVSNKRAVAKRVGACKQTGRLMVGQGQISGFQKFQVPTSKTKRYIFGFERMQITLTQRRRESRG